MRNAIVPCIVLALVPVLAACTSSPRSQTFTGALDSSWDSAPIEVRAIAGETVSAPVDADGRFRLELTGQRTYRLEVARADGTTVPFVFPRTSGADDTLYVHGGAPEFDLGSVRLLAPFDSDQMRVVLLSSTAPGVDADVECEDGVDAITGLPCVDEDDEAESCDAEDDDEVECEDGIDAATGLPCDDDDVECVDGVDAATGMPCTDDDVGGEPVHMDEAAVPDRVPPSGIGSCEDEDEGGESEHED